jgi:hypothetical protein
MAGSADKLSLRRLTLVTRSTALRQALAADCRVLAPAFTVADRAQDAWLWFRERPLAVLLPTAAVGAIWLARRPARLMTLPLRFWSLWRLWRRVAPHLR